MNEEEAASEERFFALASCLCSAISEKQVLFCKTGLRRLAKSQPKAYFWSSVQGLFQSCWILECFSSIQYVDIPFWRFTALGCYQSIIHNFHISKSAVVFHRLGNENLQRLSPVSSKEKKRDQ